MKNGANKSELNAEADARFVNDYVVSSLRNSIQYLNYSVGRNLTTEKKKDQLWGYNNIPAKAEILKIG